MLKERIPNVFSNQTCYAGYRGADDYQIQEDNSRLPLNDFIEFDKYGNFFEDDRLVPSFLTYQQATILWCLRQRSGMTTSVALISNYLQDTACWDASDNSISLAVSQIRKKISDLQLNLAECLQSIRTKGYSWEDY